MKNDALNWIWPCRHINIYEKSNPKRKKNPQNLVTPVVTALESRLQKGSGLVGSRHLELTVFHHPKFPNQPSGANPFSPVGALSSRILSRKNNTNFGPRTRRWTVVFLCPSTVGLLWGSASSRILGRSFPADLGIWEFWISNKSGERGVLILLIPPRGD